tara:strand:+ start:23 stop:997 length:975 start_codon:yes stop_codon:yes gene_type:complete
MINKISQFLSILTFCYAIVFSSEANKIRVAVLKFGSVNWELDVIKHHQLDIKNNIKIKKIVMTNKDAATIAFLSKAADIFITDWIWVNRQRNKGNLVTFSPYSNAAGALMVKENSDIKDFKDLKNKKVGVAGSSLDKSWIFLRAYGIKKYGADPLRFFNASFAAPPLINGLLKNSELDAGFNYWNYSARLEAQGFKTLITVENILPHIGVKGELPLIGYVFREKFEKENSETIKDFIKTSSQARKILMESDKEWQRISNITGANDKIMLEKIRDYFRKGVPSQDYDEMMLNMRNAYKILAQIGGKELVGKSKKLLPGTFWKLDK